jgi:hypothetical protein
MHEPWLLTLSAVSVYVYVIVVAGASTGLAILAVWRRHFAPQDGEPAPLTPQARTLIEYLGNTSCSGPSTFEARERRRNRAARLLMDHVRERALAQNAAPSEVSSLVEKLREAIQAAERFD